MHLNIRSRCIKQITFFWGQKVLAGEGSPISCKIVNPLNLLKESIFLTNTVNSISFGGISFSQKDLVFFKHFIVTCLTVVHYEFL